MGRLEQIWIKRGKGAPMDPRERATLVVGKGLLGNKEFGETRPCELMDRMVPGLREAMKSRWGGGCWAQALDHGEILVGDAISWIAPSCIAPSCIAPSCIAPPPTAPS